MAPEEKSGHCHNRWVSSCRVLKYIFILLRSGPKYWINNISISIGLCYTPFVIVLICFVPNWIKGSNKSYFQQRKHEERWCQTKKILCVSLSATSHLPAFKLSDMASSLLVITLSKRGLTQGKKHDMYCVGKHTHAPFIYTHAHSLHCATDALEKLRSMLSEDRVPTQLALTKLVQALGNNGNVAGIKELETLLKDLSVNINLSSMVFVNNIALAHIKK